MRSMVLQLLVCAAIVLSGGNASAQNSWPTPGGSIADGKVTMCLNASGQAVACGTVPAGADAVSNSTGGGAVAAFNYQFSGSAWDRAYFCNSTAVINVTAGSTTEIIPLTASQIIRVCSFAVSMSAAGTAQFLYGTGTNCGTGTTSLSGAMPLATGTPMELAAGQGNLFRSGVSNALCVAAVTGSVVGFITYAKY
ncbi:MAG: hypothetical protein PS018_20330 [bacterium]|nr:hypothetical protein [bacterium]